MAEYSPKIVTMAIWFLNLLWCHSLGRQVEAANFRSLLKKQGVLVDMGDEAGPPLEGTGLRLLSAAQLAQDLGVNPKTVLVWFRQKKIHGFASARNCIYFDARVVRQDLLGLMGLQEPDPNAAMAH